MPDKKMTAQEFVAKVSWEGGIFEALEYGLTPDRLEEADDDLTRDLRSAWADLHNKFLAMQDQISEVEDVPSAIQRSDPIVHPCRDCCATVSHTSNTN